MSTSNGSLTLVQEIGFAVNFFLNEDILSTNMKTIMVIFYSILVTIAGQYIGIFQFGCCKSLFIFNNNRQFFNTIYALLLETILSWDIISTTIIDSFWKYIIYVQLLETVLLCLTITTPDICHFLYATAFFGL